MLDQRKQVEALFHRVSQPYVVFISFFRGGNDSGISKASSYALLSFGNYREATYYQNSQQAGGSNILFVPCLNS